MNVDKLACSMVKHIYLCIAQQVGFGQTFAASCPAWLLVELFHLYILVGTVAAQYVVNA